MERPSLYTKNNPLPLRLRQYRRNLIRRGLQFLQENVSLPALPTKALAPIGHALIRVREGQHSPLRVTRRGFLRLATLTTVCLVAAESKAVADEPIKYVVKKGDRLLRIAQRFGVSFEMICRADGKKIVHPDQITVGETLFIHKQHVVFPPTNNQNKPKTEQTASSKELRIDWIAKNIPKEGMLILAVAMAPEIAAPAILAKIWAGAVVVYYIVANTPQIRSENIGSRVTTFSSRNDAILWTKRVQAKVWRAITGRPPALSEVDSDHIDVSHIIKDQQRLDTIRRIAERNKMPDGCYQPDKGGKDRILLTFNNSDGTFDAVIINTATNEPTAFPRAYNEGMPDGFRNKKPYEGRCESTWTYFLKIVEKLKEMF